MEVNVVMRHIPEHQGTRGLQGMLKGSQSQKTPTFITIKESRELA